MGFGIWDCGTIGLSDCSIIGYAHWEGRLVSRLAPKERESVRQQVGEWLTEGVIRPRSSDSMRAQLLL